MSNPTHHHHHVSLPDQSKTHPNPIPYETPTIKYPGIQISRLLHLQYKGLSEPEVAEGNDEIRKMLDSGGAGIQKEKKAGELVVKGTYSVCPTLYLSTRICYFRFILFHKTRVATKKRAPL